MNEAEFSKLMKLCRIECAAGEKDTLLANVSKVLSYIELLNELNTQDIEPCYQVLDTVTNITRDDEVGTTLPREEFLANTVQIGGMVRVPPILTPPT